MAMLKAVEEHPEALKSDIDLTLCGICLASINNPKALPCLHTFCLTCIKEWVQGETDKVKCPLCKEDFSLPPGGVSGLRTNLYVTRLKETQTIKNKVVKKEIKCTFCEKGDDVAVARCTDCKEYLCQDCVNAHRTYKVLRGHNIVSFEDIESQKVDLQKTSVKEYCTKHVGQILWFFCETCGHLICRDCAVVDHPALTHKLVNVEDVSGTYIQKLKGLSSQCQKVSQEVNKAWKAVDEVQGDLDKALENAKKELDLATAKIKSKFLKSLEEERQMISDEIDKIGSQNKSQIKANENSIQSHHLQLERALNTATHVIEKGSPYDLASMYTALTDTLQRLSKLKPVAVDRTLSKVDFEANTFLALVETPKLGIVTSGYNQIRFEKRK